MDMSNGVSVKEIYIEELQNFVVVLNLPIESSSTANKEYNTSTLITQL